MALELALLDASFEPIDAEGNFRREFDADLVRYAVREGELPPRPTEADWAHDGVAVTGSAASVYWDLEWIPPLKRWVADAVGADAPLLGVCFGHQLLAEALGGRVESMGRYELGYHMIRHDGRCRLFDGLEEWFVAFTAHSDAVAELPEGATAHAENPYSLHAFACGSAFGVQFHPEVDFETAQSLLIQRGVDGRHVQRMFEVAADGAHSEAADAKIVLRNFEAVVAESLSER